MRKLIIIMFVIFTNLLFSQKLVKITWYGSKYHGNKTASGEIFNKNKLTCAAGNQYKFGQLLQLYNPVNGKSVIVKVTDRGEFEKYGIHLDLSEEAFKQLSNLRNGIIKITVKKLNNE